MGDKFPRTLTNIALSARIERVLPESGPVAQLGARFHGMEEVIGSIPIRSTNKPYRLSSLASLPDSLRKLQGCCRVLKLFRGTRKHHLHDLCVGVSLLLRDRAGVNIERRPDVCVPQ